MFAYSLNSIDYWAGWQEEEDYLKRLRSEPFVFVEPAWSSEIAKYEEFRAKAFEAAKKAGWEGDMREGPYVSALPPHDGGGNSKLMIAWKQDNNGTTFVVSPFQLPWLGMPAARIS